MMRFTIELGLDTDGDLDAEVVFGQISIPLDTPEEVAAAEMLVARFDASDCQPGDQEIDYAKTVKVPVFGLFKVRVPTKVTARVEEIPEPVVQ